MFATKGLAALPSYQPDALRGLALLTLADVVGQPANDICSSVHLPHSCLSLAQNLIQDMERLEWPARSQYSWMV